MTNDYDLPGISFWKLKIHVPATKHPFEIVDSWCLSVPIYNQFVAFSRKPDNPVQLCGGSVEIRQTKGSRRDVVQGETTGHTGGQFPDGRGD